jgi:ParB family chromosome partitioning protein
MMNPKQNKEALGKGIRSLLQNIDTELKTPTGTLKPAVMEAATTMQRIPVDAIEENPKQPRKHFNDKSLAELSESIRMHDLVQPITVTSLPNGRFRLISGERRWRAAKLAGVQSIPAYIRQANDQELLELALLENLQREDLNALDVALSFQRMKSELGYSDEEVARRMGLDRSTVNNFTRLLKLPPAIQKSLSEGKIDRGHAIALLSLDNNINDQLKIFEEILKGPDGDYSKPLSVRRTEELVRYYKKNRAVKEAKKTESHPDFPHYKRIEDILCSHFSTKVSIQHDFNKKKGHITLSYNDTVQLNNILKQLGISAD